MAAPERWFSLLDKVHLTRLLVSLVLSPLIIFGQPANNRDLVVEVAPGSLLERRHALVIGNDRYPSAPLANAANDARAIEQALSELGFETLLAENSSLAELERSIKRFVGRIRENDVALVFYAGHGFQIEGENYIVPIDFSSDDPESAKHSSYSANKLLDSIGARRPKLQLVILDACRNNPFAVSRSLGGGLATMGAAGKGTFIALATAPGKTASDNPNGVNGLFTTALLKVIKRKGVSLTELFDEVKREVSMLSADDQRPWTNSDYAGKWFFLPPDDYIPEEIDPTSSLRLLEEARKSEKNLFYNDAAEMYERLLGREKDSEMGLLAKTQITFLRALVATQGAVDSHSNPLESAAQLKSVWELLPSRGPLGLDAASNFLVSGKVPEAVEILGRLRGADQETAFRATEMLQELARTFPVATDALASPFKALPPDPASSKPKSRFEGMAAKLKAQAVLQQKQSAAEAQALAPVTGVLSGLPPPTTEGWLLRVETLKPPTPKPSDPSPSIASNPEVTPVPEPKPAPSKAANLVKVEFQSRPEGAMVNLSQPGIAPCKTSCTVELRPGLQTATLTLPGFRPVIRTWEVSKSQALVAVDLEPLMGTAFISTAPDSALIEVDGKMTQLHTPAKLALPPGDYVVSIWDGNIRVRQQQKFSLKDAETLSIAIKTQ